MTEVSIEDQARQLGWHPESEFKGDPEKFTDAEEFVKRGQEILPILQENNKKLSSRVDSLEKTVKDQVAYNERTLTSQRESMQAAYDKELERIVEDGDQEAFAKLKKPEIPEAPQADMSAEDEQVYNKFIAEHDWYGTDTALTAAASAISDEIAKAYPGLTAKQNLDKTLIRLGNDFPHKFGNGEAKGGSPVESGRRISKKKSGHTYEDLPAEAKTVCNNFIKEGIIENRDAYVASYDFRSE